MSHVQPQPHRRGRKWRRFVRENQSLFFMVFFLVLILALIVVVFWWMGSIQFINLR
jgi:phosphotransferase system  glucose/maltose/N-acetylglucosamine-specific IIC component